MTKETFIDYMLYTAKYWQKLFVENGGEVGQCLFLVKPDGEVIGSVNAGTTLHGSRCADFVRKFAREHGPAQCVAILSDTRMKTMSAEERAAMPNTGTEIADDPRNQEALLLAGRCAVHAAAIVMEYSRAGGLITFKDAEPTITFSSDDKERFVLNLLPDDIWETVH